MKRPLVTHPASNRGSKRFQKNSKLEVHHTVPAMISRPLRKRREQREGRESVDIRKGQPSVESANRPLLTAMVTDNNFDVGHDGAG